MILDANKIGVSLIKIIAIELLAIFVSFYILYLLPTI